MPKPKSRAQIAEELLRIGSYFPNSPGLDKIIEQEYEGAINAIKENKPLSDFQIYAYVKHPRPNQASEVDALYAYLLNHNTERELELLEELSPLTNEIVILMFKHLFEAGKNGEANFETQFANFRNLVITKNAQIPPEVRDELFIKACQLSKAQREVVFPLFEYNDSQNAQVLFKNPDTIPRSTTILSILTTAIEAGNFPLLTQLSTHLFNKHLSAEDFLALFLTVLAAENNGGFSDKPGLVGVLIAYAPHIDNYSMMAQAFTQLFKMPADEIIAILSKFKDTTYHEFSTLIEPLRYMAFKHAVTIQDRELLNKVYALFHLNWTQFREPLPEEKITLLFDLNDDHVALFWEILNLKDIDKKDKDKRVQILPLVDKPFLNNLSSPECQHICEIIFKRAIDTQDPTLLARFSKNFLILSPESSVDIFKKALKTADPQLIDACFQVIPDDANPSDVIWRLKRAILDDTRQNLLPILFNLLLQLDLDVNGWQDMQDCRIAFTKFPYPIDDKKISAVFEAVPHVLKLYKNKETKEDAEKFNCLLQEIASDLLSDDDETRNGCGAHYKRVIKELYDETYVKYNRSKALRVFLNVLVVIGSILFPPFGIYAGVKLYRQSKITDKVGLFPWSTEQQRLYKINKALNTVKTDEADSPDEEPGTRPPSPKPPQG